MAKGIHEAVLLRGYAGAGTTLRRSGPTLEEALPGFRQVRRDTAHVFPVFGQESNPAFAERGQRLTTQQRDEIFERAITPRGGQASAYQRLKLAMDYWCSLWFWPVEQGTLLPSRDEFLLELSAILEGTSQELSPLLGAEQQPLFPTGKPEQEQLRLAEEFGLVNLDELCASLPRLKKVRDFAEKHRFLHWELEFADLFEDQGGFDLILGNPPWMKIDVGRRRSDGRRPEPLCSARFPAPTHKNYGSDDGKIRCLRRDLPRRIR